MKEHLLAFDLALGVTGYAVFEIDTHASDVSIVKVGNINTQKIDSKNRSGKLNLIGKEILKLKKKYKPSEIAIEKGFSRFNRSTQALFSALGVAQYILHGLPQYLYAPATVKKTATGAGNASKEQVLLSMEEFFPYIDFGNTDESDAVAVGYHHLRKTGVL